MPNPINYRIVTKNYSEIIQSDRTEFMPNTGQALFYLNNVMMHIAPADAFVTNVDEEIYLKEKFMKLESFVYKSLDSTKEFWKGFLERNKTYDASDDIISEEDKIGRKLLLQKVDLLTDIDKLIARQ